MKRLALFALSSILLFSLTHGSQALESRTLIRHEAGGAFLQSERVGETVSLFDAGLPLPEMGVLWQRTIVPPIYTSCALGDGAGDAYVTTGSELNSAVVEMIPFGGDGTPDWSQPTPGAYVAAGGDIFAAVEANSAINGATITCRQDGAETPLWTKDVTDCGIPARVIRVSDTGTRVVVALSKQNGPDFFPRLYCLDAANGDLISSFDGAVSTFPRGLELSADGSLAALRASYNVHVVETDTGTERWVGNVSASADPLAFSADGDWVASGWTGLFVYHWNGVTYETAFVNNGGGAAWYLRSCAFTPDGGKLAAGWYTGSFNQNKILLFDTATAQLEWTYTYAQGAGQYQDLPSDIAIDEAGHHIVVGSWGDQANSNPEIEVFAVTDPDPIFTVDAPGSIYDVDITSALPEGGGSKITACGKHVHANELGNSGDLFAIEIVETAAGEWTPAGPVTLSAFPNPFNPRVTLSYRLAAPGALRLDIFAPDGRRVRRLLSAEQAAGAGSIVWDGRTQGGAEAPSGVYLARLASPAGAATQRLVLLR